MLTLELLTHTQLPAASLPPVIELEMITDNNEYGVVTMVEFIETNPCLLDKKCVFN